MKFIGKYVQDIKLAAVASAVSGHNMVLISAPGYGKTEMVRQAAETISGGIGNIFLELDPATPPEVIKGSYDPAALLNGKLSRILDGTPYDPTARIVILDEFFRSNDVVFDSLVHATNRKDINQTTRPVFWGTTNFIGKAERTEALRDRFAMWMHLEPEVRTRDIIKAHLMNGTGVDDTFSAGLPTWQECVDIRASQPGTGALGLISDMVDDLAGEARKSGFTVNPRRIVQWAELSYRTAHWFSKTNDFVAVPTQVSKVLGWAYPTTDKAEAQKWATVCSQIVDSVGAAIESYRANALAKFRAAAAANGSDKSAMAIQLGGYLAECVRELCGLVKVDPALYHKHGNPADPENPLRDKDPRVAQTFVMINGWFAAAISGQEIIG